MLSLLKLFQPFAIDLGCSYTVIFVLLERYTDLGCSYTVIFVLLERSADAMAKTIPDNKLTKDPSVVDIKTRLKRQELCGISTRIARIKTATLSQADNRVILAVSVYDVQDTNSFMIKNSIEPNCMHLTNKNNTDHKSKRNCQTRTITAYNKVNCFKYFEVSIQTNKLSRIYPLIFIRNC